MSGENQRLYDHAEKFLPGGNTRSTLYADPFTPYAIDGTGVWVTDADGHKTIDCNNNYTALIHGHRPQEVLEAVRETLEWGISFGLPTPLEITMAETLTSRFPHIDQWRFGNSGTEAVMQAIRIARAATGRDIIIRFTGAYHGTSDAVVDPAAPGIPKNIVDVSIDVPFGDAEAFEDIMSLHGQKVAAVLVDLMPNRAGLIPASPEFANLLREKTRSYGALLIVDEVISFRMSGGGLQGLYGIEPDLTTLGKVIGGGFPVGAVGGTRQVMEIVDPRKSGHMAWGGTFSANPITLAAGLATLKTFDSAAVEALNTKGNRLRADLNAAGLETKGAGSLLKIIVGGDAKEAWQKSYAGGVLIGVGGLMALSTAMSDEDVDGIRDKLVATFC